MIDDFGGELDIDRAVAFLIMLPMFAPWFLRIEFERGVWFYLPRRRS